MKLKKLFMVILSLSLILGPAAFITQPAAADPIYTCLPTCEIHDGRMLTVSGAGLATLAGLEISISFGAPADSTALEIGVFDGETGGMWDLGTEPLEFTLFADPNATGATAVQLNQWSGTEMLDDDWFAVSVPPTPEARAASGHYFYHLRIRTPNPNPVFYSLFKVRSDGVTSLLPRPFAYFASFTNAIDIVYPNLPDVAGSTYDGMFDFHTYVPNSPDRYVVYDGDTDFGSSDGLAADSDDPDTPNNSIPAFSSPSAVFEGVAVGTNGSTGNPPDDYMNQPYLIRSPNVTYAVSPLDQTPYVNANPSGNLEWESFILSTEAGDSADYIVEGDLPAGLYHIHVDGVDMHNLNAWRFQHNVLGVCEFDPTVGEVNPCKDPLGPKMIGDTVFLDSNVNGVQDAGEPGIAGVRMLLYNGNGQPLLDINNDPIFTTTDANGIYYFDVQPRLIDEYTSEVIISGEYTVQVAATNFEAGGPLVGLRSTTGGESQTYTVIDENVLTYDFGYFRKVRPVRSGVAPYSYWRGHPDEWPVDSLTIGGVEYSKEAAIELLSLRMKGDKSLALFAQMVAALLNIEDGNEGACIEADLVAAHEWLETYPPQSEIFGYTEEWKAIRESYTNIWMYNSGQACAPARRIPRGRN